MEVLKACKDERRIHREHRNGYTNDRGKSMRKILSFHPSVLFHPEFSKYFDKEMDPHERRKNMYAFAHQHPEYMVVDKL